MNEEFGHRSVLENEVIGLLQPQPHLDFADLTIGAGGHAERILEVTTPDGRLFGFDRDELAIERAGERLARFGERVSLVCAPFSKAAASLTNNGVRELNGVLMDLGVSSMQLDAADRGFAIKKDGPLDMRMSPTQKTTAADLVAKAGVADLERIFRDYGEEPRARAIARKIFEVRKRTRIKRTRELAELVRTVAKGRGRGHPATRVFQALRIAVNSELDELEQTLPAMMNHLAVGGRIAVISFHSLEDRIVKNRFREAERAGEGHVLTKRAIVPEMSEVKDNPRSRSAKLRAFAKG